MAWALIAQGGAETDGGTCTSASMDTTGADLAVVMCNSHQGGAPYVADGDITDNKGNVWVKVDGPRSPNDTAFFYSFLDPGKVGSGHTVTNAPSGFFGGAFKVAFFSGSDGATLNHSGFVNSGNAPETNLSCGATGTLTAGNLVVCGFVAFDASQTSPGVDTGTALTAIAGHTRSVDLSWEDYAGTTSITRHWNSGFSTNFPVGGHLAFEPDAGGGGGGSALSPIAVLRAGWGNL